MHIWIILPIKPAVVRHLIICHMLLPLLDHSHMLTSILPIKKTFEVLLSSVARTSCYQRQRLEGRQVILILLLVGSPMKLAKPPLSELKLPYYFCIKFDCFDQLKLMFHDEDG